MSAYREFTGKSVEEALKSAREAFGIGLEELDFELFDLLATHAATALYCTSIYSRMNKGAVA